MIAPVLTTDPEGAPLNRKLARVYEALGLPRQAAQAAMRTAAAITWLDPGAWRFAVGDHDRIELRGGDGAATAMFVVRTFPATHPEEYLSVRGWDEHGDEVELGMIRRLADCRYAGQGYEVRFDVPAEQAGGLASDGERRIMEIAPAKLHQRTPIFVGSKADVAVANGRVVAVGKVAERGKREPRAHRVRGRPPRHPRDAPAGAPVGRVSFLSLAA